MCTSFVNILESPFNSGRQKGELQQVTYCGPRDSSATAQIAHLIQNCCAVSCPSPLYSRNCVCSRSELKGGWGRILNGVLQHKYCCCGVRNPSSQRATSDCKIGWDQEDASETAGGTAQWKSRLGTTRFIVPCYVRSAVGTTW
jgi:hypothetical protein